MIDPLLTPSLGHHTIREFLPTLENIFIIEFPEDILRNFWTHHFLNSEDQKVSINDSQEVILELDSPTKITSPVAIQTLIECASSINCKGISIKNCLFEPVVWEFFYKAVEDHTSIISIHFNQCNLRGENLSSLLFYADPQKNRFESFSIITQSIDEELANAVRTFSDHQSLKKLNLCNVTFTENSENLIFDSLKDNLSITDLNLSGTVLNCKTYPLLGLWISRNIKLCEFNFANCSLNDRTLRNLSEAFVERLNQFDLMDDIDPLVSLDLSGNPVTKQSIELLFEVESLFKCINLQNTFVDPLSTIFSALELGTCFTLKLNTLNFTFEQLSIRVSRLEEMDADIPEGTGWRFVCDVASTVSPALLEQVKKVLEKYHANLEITNYTPSVLTANVSSTSSSVILSGGQKRSLENHITENRTPKLAKCINLLDILNGSSDNDPIACRELLAGSINNPHSPIYFDPEYNQLKMCFEKKTIISSLAVINILLELLKETNEINSLHFDKCVFVNGTWNALMNGLKQQYISDCKLHNMHLSEADARCFFEIHRAASEFYSLSFVNTSFEPLAEKHLTDHLEKNVELIKFHFECREFETIDEILINLHGSKKLQNLKFRSMKLGRHIDKVKPISYLCELIAEKPTINVLAIENCSLSYNDLKTLRKAMILQKKLGVGILDISLSGSKLNLSMISPFFDQPNGIEIIRLHNRTEQMNDIQLFNLFKRSEVRELHLGEFVFSPLIVKQLQEYEIKEFTCTNPSRMITMTTDDVKSPAFQLLKSYLAKGNVALIATPTIP